MGRDLAMKLFARAGAVLGLAAITSIGMFGSAAAAPADRPTDPVVLKGTDLPALAKTAADRVVGYKWQGRWIQIPVQVDERHTITARSLYPENPPGYVNDGVSFDIEVYADPKTRSGADLNKNFDADDELVFMGGDAGGSAPAAAVEPGGVVAGSGNKVAVNDPISGGEAFVYLFAASGKADQSAGKDYVDYDFNLVNFGPNDTLINDYGFTNTGNPEDSTVKTDNYELHSIDRWMEDELKITAGGAPGIDILDREAISAGGLGGCSRSEYTFSANWTLDATPGNDTNTDDEGTYINVIDGPVRAIRSYMGANSGPYVEDLHIYYPDRHDRKINVRVHPIPEMYVWTDYNVDATGMKYRDQKNTAGVDIDGVPDVLEGATMADFEDGQYLWQQVSGSHGTATTMVAAESSATPGNPTNFGFKSYYLDNENPSTSSGAKERQCGGDLKAYGASGFGIDGVYPNTDPMFATAASTPEKLSVNRVRYFSGPNGTAADAEAFRARAQDSLTGTGARASLKARSVKLRARVQGKPKAKRGKRARVRVRVVNRGTVASARGRVCVTGKAIANTCKRVARINAGKARNVMLTPRVKKRARGKQAALRIQAVASGKKANARVKLRIRR